MRRRWIPALLGATLTAAALAGCLDPYAPPEESTEPHLGREAPEDEDALEDGDPDFEEEPNAAAPETTGGGEGGGG